MSIEKKAEIVKSAEYKAPATLEDFQAVERMDESQIMEELQGKQIDKLFYEFTQGNRQVIALSWAGVKYFAIQLGHIQVQEVKLDETEDSYRVIAWAYDKTKDLRVMGAAEQSKFLAWDTKKKDEFALAKAVSKGQRNALRNLIPETMISSAYAEWKLRLAKAKPINPLSPQK